MNNFARSDIQWDQCCEQLDPRIGKMTYKFYQDTGRFVGGEGNARIETYGYSGKDGGMNNPKDQCVPNYGPLPATNYEVGKCKNYMHNPPVLRPCSWPLIPLNESEMCNRFAFLVHGCKTTTVGDMTTPPSQGCSEGCVVVNVQNRIKLREGDLLIVESNDPEKQTKQQ